MVISGVAFAGSALGFLSAWLILNEAARKYHRRISSRVSEDLRTQFVHASRTQLSIAGILPCLVFLVTPLFGMPWPFALLLGACSLGIPLLWARRLRKQRHAQFIAQLPDALLALASSLRAGANLSQAIALTAQRQPMPLGQEFSLVQGRQRLGDDLNTPRDALARLEVMALMAGMELPARAIREQIASAIDVIIQLSRLSDGSRKVVAITQVDGMEGERILLNDLFRYDPETGHQAVGIIT